nr:ribosome-associated translation inhibitor RaiA [Aeoliella straminimaris]
MVLLAWLGESRPEYWNGSRAVGPATPIQGNLARAPSVQVRVSTRHGHLSEASQAKIASKAEKLLRIFDRLSDIVVVVDLKDEQTPKVDVQVSAEHKHDFMASEQSTEMMVAVDAALQKIEQQLRKYKNRVVERNRDRDRQGRQVEAEHTPEEE